MTTGDEITGCTWNGFEYRHTWLENGHCNWCGATQKDVKGDAGNDPTAEPGRKLVRGNSAPVPGTRRSN